MSRLTRYLLVLLLTLALQSCQRQELEDPYQYLAYIPISMDWSNSLLDLDEVGNVSIYFYPSGGGEPIVKTSGDLYYKLVELPVGSYRVLIFNDLINNIKGVEFNNHTSYDDFRVNFIEDTTTTPTYYQMEEQDALATEHSRVAAWYLDELVVDATMVEYTRSEEFEEYIAQVRSKSESKSAAVTKEGSSSSDDEEPLVLPTSKSAEITKSATKALEDLSNVVPDPETTILSVKVRVENLNNAQYIETTIKGTAAGTYLGSDAAHTVDEQTLVYDMVVTNREYDDPSYGVDGYVNFSLNTFGRVDDDEEYTIYFYVVLQNGELLEFERDVTEQFITSEGGTIEINLGDEDDTEMGIELPEYSEAGFDVSGWDDSVDVYL